MYAATAPHIPITTLLAMVLTTGIFSQNSTQFASKLTPNSKAPTSTAAPRRSSFSRLVVICRGITFSRQSAIGAFRGKL
jgi:hypothetical protein